MELKVCAIYDKRAIDYGTPQCFPTLGIAERAFADAVRTEGNPINKHPEDYSLYHIGTWDSTTAKMENHPPQLICEAMQLVAQ